MDLRLLACWDCEFESRRGLGCPSRVIILCCQVEVPATGRSPVQRSPTDCDLFLSVILKPRQLGAIGPLVAVEPREKISPFTIVVGRANDFY